MWPFLCVRKVVQIKYLPNNYYMTNNNIYGSVIFLEYKESLPTFFIMFYKYSAL